MEQLDFPTLPQLVTSDITSGCFKNKYKNVLRVTEYLFLSKKVTSVRIGISSRSKEIYQVQKSNLIAGPDKNDNDK